VSYVTFASPLRRPKPITRRLIPQVSSGLHSWGGSDNRRGQITAVEMVQAKIILVGRHYFLVLPPLDSALVTLSGIQIVGLNKSRSPYLRSIPS
jgi:hypothetical protein